MKDLLPLAEWSPKVLIRTYENSCNSSKEDLNENFPQIKEALYRLGTNFDMKACWEKLLSKKTFFPEHEMAITWLVHEIHLMLINVFIRSDVALTPQFKKKEIEKIVDLVHKLIISINNSNEALGASFYTVHAQLSKEIIKKNPEKSAQIGFDVAPISSWSFISGVRDVLESNQKVSSLEPLGWDSWTVNKKSEWLLGNIRDINLISVLRVYLEQLDEIPNTYALEYIASNRATITKKIFELMHKVYGEYMTDCVTPMVNAILDLELGVEDITPYKPKEKSN